MNLLDTYIAEVGSHLPRKNRLDVQAEIRSTIEDMLEDRSRESGRPVDDAMIGEVLQEYGAPETVAAAYQPTRYLIGPRLYPTFELVVKIVFAVLTVMALVGFALSFASKDTSGPIFITVLGKNGLQLLAALISALGYIVVVFAILERVLPQAEFEEKASRWTPADLNAEPDPDEIKRSSLIFEILFTTLGLVVLNLYPQLIGIAFRQDSGWFVNPLLSEAFFVYLPWINLLGILHILLDLFLLRQGSWKLATRLFKLALEAAGILLAAAMLVGPSLVSLDPARMTAIFGEAAGTMTRLFILVPQIVLVIIIIVQSVEVLQAIWRLLNPRSTGRALPVTK